MKFYQLIITPLFVGFDTRRKVQCEGNIPESLGRQRV